jgi:glycosyltransferase involved in cell wall biosynthesis
MEKSLKYNYSIIIPHKNIPHLLQRCLDTIPERDDTQIVIVDDNSDDTIVDFSNYPGMLRKNTEVYFTKEGKGAGFARNIGLSHALGKYVLFADADDYFNYCIHEILDEYIDCDTELIFFGVNSVNSDTYRNETRHLAITRYMQTYFQNNKKGLDILRFESSSPVSKMVLRDIITKNNIWFDETRINNDVNFAVKIGYYTETHKVDQRALYCITRRGDSLESEYTSSFKMEHSLIHFDVWTRKSVFCETHNLPFSRRLRVYNLLTEVYKRCAKEDYRQARDVVINAGFTEYEVDKAVAKRILLYPLRNSTKKVVASCSPLCHFLCKRLKIVGSCKYKY